MELYSSHSWISMTAFNTKRTFGPTPNYPRVLAYARTHEDLITIAGPCSIESSEQIHSCASTCLRAGVSYMRGGIYRAGTYPPKDFGLQKELLVEWSRIAHFYYNIKTIVEVLDFRLLKYLDQFADAFQVGARQMQNYALLKELSNQSKSVALKRNPGATLDEFLGAAEYLLSGSMPPPIILIERGSATHSNHVRWDLSCSIISAVKKMTKIPILVDSSHGSGRRDLVTPLTLAGIAAGADGYLVEFHPTPEKSLSDADQAISIDDFINLNQKVFQLKGIL